MRTLMNKDSKKTIISILLIGFINLFVFGFYINSLGFYLDDWAFFTPFRLNGYAGDGLSWFLTFEDRLSSGSFFRAALSIFGFRPLYWQIFTVGLHFLSALAIWTIFHLLFPKKFRFNLSVALLFSVFPTFRQLPTALSYSLHWFSFFLLMLSFILTIFWITKKKVRFIYWVLSLLLATYSFFIIEYFIPLEGLRLLIIAYLLRNDIKVGDDHQIIKWLFRSFKRWIPYFISLGIILFWRFSMLPTGGVDRNLPDFDEIRYTPIAFIKTRIIYFLGDLRKIFIDDFVRKNPLRTIWGESDPFIWLLAILGISFLVFWVLDRMQRENKQKTNIKWIAFMLLIGLFAMILGFLPPYFIGRYYSEGNSIYSDRFALASLLGASIFFIALLELIPVKQVKNFLLALLIGSFSILHIQNAQVYVDSYQRLNDFIWQLSWRAPSIEPVTAIYSDGEFIPKMGGWPMSIAINNLYVSSYRAHLGMDYWFFDLDDGIPADIEEKKLYENHSGIQFSGMGGQAIAIDYDPDKHKCLWVLSQADTVNPELSDIGKKLSSLSKIERIYSEPKHIPPQDIFKNEPAHEWCYFYQSAALAAQNEDWNRISSLWRDAVKQGFRSEHAKEYLPFIKAFIQLGDIDQAKRLVDEALAKNPLNKNYLIRSIENSSIDKTSTEEMLNYLQSK